MNCRDQLDGSVEEMTITSGTHLGRYEIRSKIGAGGMGEVDLAQDTKLDRKVALKILPADVAAHPDRMKRFVQEAKAASALNHPNIITIHEIDETDSGHFIATEFIDGETLRERQSKGSLRLAESLDIATQIASALSAAHAAGNVHRDVKPENVMIRRDGIVKVLDFGLAKLTAPALAREIQRALEIDPTSEFAKSLTVFQYQMLGKYDEWLAAYRKLYPDEPISAWYFLGKGRLEEAQKRLEERSAKQPDDIELPRQKALLLALKGDFNAAKVAISSILSKHPLKDLNYHHAAYDIACIYALEGKSNEAVKWLREAAATGFPCYPLFARDAYLNRIRQAPEFIQFMTEMKAQNERYRREFEGATQ